MYISYEYRYKISKHHYNLRIFNIYNKTNSYILYHKNTRVNEINISEEWLHTINTSSHRSHLRKYFIQSSQFYVIN